MDTKDSGVSLPAFGAFAPPAAWAALADGTFAAGAFAGNLSPPYSTGAAPATRVVPSRLLGRFKSKMECDFLDDFNRNDANLPRVCSDQGLVTNAVNQPWNTQRIAVNRFNRLRREYRGRL